MNANIFIYGMAAGIIILSIIIGLLARRWVVCTFARKAAQTDTPIDDIIAKGIKNPIVLWCLAIGLSISVRVLDLPKTYDSIIAKSIVVVVLLSITMVAMGITSELIKTYFSKSGAATSTGLTQNVVKFLIFSIGVMIILNSLGISITPLITTLGIGGLAVALAVQDTLSNLFAGFHITLSGELHIGDYVKLNSGEEGYVTDISWRTTKLRMLPNNYILIPNAKMAQAIITNYNMKDPEMAVFVDVGVHYNSDLEQIEKIVIEVAKETLQEVPEAVASFEPFIRYHTFGDSSINFNVALRTREFVGQNIIRHTFIKKLHHRFKQEGITIPYPIRAINLDQEGASGRFGTPLSS